MFKNNHLINKNRLLVLGNSGSHTYGTNHPNSDHDEKGIFVPELHNIFTLNDVDTISNIITKVEDKEFDYEYHSLKKFITDLALNHTYAYELLNLRPCDYLIIHPLFEELLEHKNELLSQELFATYEKTAFGHLKRAEKTYNTKQGTRKELIAQYGYDTKSMSHSIRFVDQMTEVLETGQFVTYRENHEFLKDIIFGKFSFEEMANVFNERKQRMDNALKTTDLPTTRNYDLLNEISLNIHKKFLKEYDLK